MNKIMDSNLDAGLKFFNAKQFQNALSKFLIVERENHPSCILSNLIGMCYVNLNDSFNAKLYFNKSTEANSNYFESYFNLGLLEFAEGNFEVAASNFLKVLASDPSKKDVKDMIIKCYEKSNCFNQKELSSFNKNEFSTVIRFSSLDDPFIDQCIDNVVGISNKVVLICFDKLYDGKSDLEGISSIINRNKSKNVEFQIISFDELNKEKMVKQSGWIVKGFNYVKHSAPYILFIDGDEIAEKNKLLFWKKRFNTTFYSLRFTCFWYFREPVFQAQKLEYSPLMVSANFLNFLLSANSEIALKQQFDRNFYDFSDLMYTNDVIFHHYSWVRTKKQMLTKVKNWGHKNDKDWVSLVEKEFSREFNGSDFVHGYEYKTVQNIFNIKI